MIEIEVVYAATDRQVLRSFKVDEGTSVRAALIVSGVAEEFPELDLTTCPVGIFGKVVADPDQQVVQPADRLEIYRPLLADPKEIRRLRAAKAAQARQADQ
ncbi:MULTISPECIES: RnfH family protein [Pseudomonas]|uniref:RnfH family protein n=1 Tax=Pseudomonas TaxID=286 RepID=UPI0004BE30CF|nr:MULTISPECIES: RnfH family protein [Pseudomonas]MBJ2348711.1 RnfH family protein [Pseudomonas canavaninivorans]MBL3544335.1 RnfH family protein [Pseudomonas sp. HB05]